MRGAAQNIATLRARYGQVKASIARYEGIVAEQSVKLDRLNRANEGSVNLLDNDNNPSANKTGNERKDVTEDNLKREEEEIRELEAKKKVLEERVSSMERDLGGLLR